MTTLGQFPKPEADRFAGQRKLLLAPTFAIHPGDEGEGRDLLDRYWSEVRDHVHNLERSLGAVRYVFHEALFAGGEEGMRLIEQLNPLGYSFISALCQSTATLTVTEDGDTLHENFDWQRCLSIGLASEKVRNLAVEGYQDTTRRRYEQMRESIDATLGEGETGALFISEDHGVQFPADVQVFYVAPPSLDALKRWLAGQMRGFSPPS